MARMGTALAIRYEHPAVVSLERALLWSDLRPNSFSDYVLGVQDRIIRSFGIPAALFKDLDCNYSSARLTR